jgi:hypothetical protein
MGDSASGLTAHLTFIASKPLRHPVLSAAVAGRKPWFAGCALAIRRFDQKNQEQIKHN